ncbi:WS/DGAT domain-containing protein, partial [Cellulomonas septica]
LAPLGARLVARLGLLPRFLHRQRVISTVVTHAPGPPGPVRLVGVPLVATVPLVPLVGNVTTCVAALSISGRLDVAVLCAPESADLVQALADDLRDGLRQVADLAPRLP